MSNLIKHAEYELGIILNGIDRDKDPDGYEMQKVMNNDILELVKLFSSQGDTGCTAHYKIEKLKRLLDFKPISPITGNDDEWNDCGLGGTQQNKRISSLFRENRDNSTAHDIDRYVTSDNGGLSWFGGGGVARKLGYDEKVTFPYVPQEKPTRIYIRYKDIKTHDDYEDITGDEKAIQELREEYKKNPQLWRW